MTNPLPSKIVKGATSAVSQALNAVDRAREIYLAQMKRAEADYFDRIKRAAGVVTEGETSDEVVNKPPPVTAPADQSPPSAI